MKRIITFVLLYVMFVTVVSTVAIAQQPRSMRGDVNVNGVIDAMDYVFLKRAYFGTYRLNESAEQCGDVNENQVIDAMDYVFLKRAYFGTYNLEKQENNDNNTESGESRNENDTNNQVIYIFNTKNIKRITFFTYYGSGKGSDVPAEHLGEITTWLNSFKIDTDREFPDLVPPGTNTIHVEIEYLDGTVVKEGLDTATVDGITYYIKGDTAPKCYEEIISKTSFN